MPTSILGSFQPLGDFHCCTVPRKHGPRRFHTVDNALRAGRWLQRSVVSKPQQCEAQCRMNSFCSHFSHSELEGDCTLCQGCALNDSVSYTSWRRMGRPSSYYPPGLNASHGTWGGCRFDDDHSGSTASLPRHCVYKTEVEASLSMAGNAWEYYHFLIDLAPRVLFAMRRDRCGSATLAAPGWHPQHSKGTFSLTSTRAKTSQRLPSMVHHARALFPGSGLCASACDASPPHQLTCTLTLAQVAYKSSSCQARRRCARRRVATFPSSLLSSLGACSHACGWKPCVIACAAAPFSNLLCCHLCHQAPLSVCY